jgi:hypothetical protein
MLADLRRLQVQWLAAFLIAVALVLVYALRGGGSYDIVAFEEHGLAIWVLLGAGIATGILPRARLSRAQLMLLGSLLAYAGWTALSLLWTSSAERTFEEIARTLDYLGLVALLSVVLDRDTWVAAGAGVGAAAMAVCVIAVGGRLDPSVFGRDHVDAVLHIDRMSFPFGYWNAVGAWGAISTAIGLAWSAHDSNRWRRSLALAFVPVAGATTYLTYSRAGVAGTALAVIAVVALSRNRLTALAHSAIGLGGAGLAILTIRGAPQIAHGTGTGGAARVAGALVIAGGACAAVAVLTRSAGLDSRRVPRRWFRAMLGSVAVVAVLAAAIFGPHLASRGWHSFTRVPTTAAESGANTTARLTSLSGTRYQVWKAAIKAFEAHPIGGLGAGTFGFWWNQHATDSESLLDVHNIWLQNLAELGIPGLLLIVAVAAGAIWVAVSVRRRASNDAGAGAGVAFTAAFLVYLLHASVDWMWESTAVTVLALSGVAILGASLGAERARWRLPRRAIAAAIAALAAITQLPGLVSTDDIANSQTAARGGHYALALSWAKNAVAAEPWSASALEQEGLVLEATHRLGAAASDQQRAIADEPLNYEHWLILARIKTESGQLGAAVRDHERARSLAPRALVFSLAP